MEKEKCFECKAPQSLICWTGSKRIVLCTECLSNIIKTEETSTVLVISNNSKPNWSELTSIKSLEHLHIFIEKRLRRLRYQKEKYLLDLQIAAEELKNLVDKEILKIIQQFTSESDKSESKLTSLLLSFAQPNHPKVKFLTKSLISPEPIEFDLITEPILSSLSCLARYRFTDLEESSNILPFFSRNELKFFIPAENKTETISKAKLRLLSTSSFCFVPNDWIFIAGGRNNSSTLNFSQKIRINRSKVFNLQPLNESRHSFGMIYSEGFVFAFGGKNDEQVLSSCEKFCFRTQEWLNISSMNEGRYQISLAVTEDFIILAGLGSETIEKFSLLNETFATLRVKKEIDEVVRVVLAVDEKIVLFGSKKVTFLEDCQEENAVDESQVQVQGSGPCVQFEEWSYLEMNEEIWKVNRISNKFVKHLEA